jgi:biotin operon repressor
MPSAQDVLFFLQRQTSPIKGAAIAAAVGLDDDEQVRGCVNELRRRGELICANNKGYWLTDNPDEAENYVKEFEGRVRSQNEAITGMRGTIEIKRAVARVDAGGQGRLL